MRPSDVQTFPRLNGGAGMSLILTIMVAGALGGGAYCLMNHHPAYPHRSQEGWVGEANLTVGTVFDWLWKLLISVVLGNAAAFAVPVFLHATSSDLIREITESAPTENSTQGKHDSPDAKVEHKKGDPGAWYVFFGFCVLAAYAAQQFLQLMLGHILKELDQQKHRVDKVEETVNSFTDDFSEPENEKGMAAVGPRTTLTAEETRVLTAFHRARAEKQWLRRSMEGLAADTGLPREQVAQLLEHLVLLGLVENRPGRGRASWLLSVAGLSWKPPEANRDER